MTRGLQIMQLNTDRRVRRYLSIHPAGGQRAVQARTAGCSTENNLLLKAAALTAISPSSSPLCMLTNMTAVCITVKYRLEGIRKNISYGC